jgi:hypothetical protein
MTEDDTIRLCRARIAATGAGLGFTGRAWRAAGRYGRRSQECCLSPHVAQNRAQPRCRVANWAGGAAVSSETAVSPEPAYARMRDVLAPGDTRPALSSVVERGRHALLEKVAEPGQLRLVSPAAEDDHHELQVRHRKWGGANLKG